VYPVTKYSRYQDYVIRDGRLVGEFEQMYQDFADPWNATTAEEFASEKAVGINLLARLRARGQIRTVMELGCGLGHYSARIAALGLEVTGVDISATAVAKAQERHAGPEFVVGGLDDFGLLRQRRPDVIVMAEITWYVLNQLRGFLDFLRTELPQTYVLHLLSTYPPGVQKYGSDFFTDLPGIQRYFGMKYLESGEVHQARITRTWFLGTWRTDNETAWP
jgi:SAM-dependent methyltransferase